MSKTFGPQTSAFVSASLRATLCAGAAIALALPAVAFAQRAPDEAPPARDDPAAEGTGNDIIVTATKREQTLQDVPVAVTVTTADTIQRAQIRDIKDLSSVVPSLRVGQRQSSAQTDFLIRGFGNGANNAGIEPSVGVFIDGVYRSRSSAQIADFPDVKRIEVLRGPQSTLFGKNASVGIISVVTQSPQFKTGGSAELSYGNYNALVARAVITGGITDTIAVSLAGGYNGRDGWAKDGNLNSDIDNRNRWFVRGQLLFEPNTQLKVRLIADYGKMDERCCAVASIRAAAPTAAIQALGGKINAPANGLDNVYFNNFPSTNRIKNYGFSGQVDYAIGPLTLTSITALRRVRNISNQDSDFTSLDLLGRNYANLGIRTFTQEFRAATNLDGPLNFLVGAYYFNEKIKQDGQIYYGSQARLFANALTGGTLGTTDGLTRLETLISGLTGQNYLGRFFAANTGLNESYGLNNESISVFGQVDFKIADRLTLTGGINYTHDKKNFNTTGTNSTDAFSSIQLSNLATPALNFFIAQGVGQVLGVPGGIASAAQVNFVRNANPAGFAQIAAAAQNGVNSILALKPYQFLPPFLSVPNAVENGRTSDGKVTYTARLAYDLDSNINTYLSFATGFKASSINLSRDSRPAASDQAALVASGLALANQTYGSRFAGPENSTVYEAGVKGRWGTTSLNVAVFKQIIKGFQSNLFTGTGFILGNAGKESVWGVEAEGAIRPVPELTLTGAITWLNPKYDSFVQSPFGDASGLTPAGIARFTSSVSGTWDHPFANGNHLIVRADWRYESKVQMLDGLPGFIQRNPITGAVITYQPGLDAAKLYTRKVSEINGSITYALASGLSVSVWGRNLNNNRYYLTIFDSPLQSGAVSAYPNQPRTFGGSVMYKF